MILCNLKSNPLIIFLIYGYSSIAKHNSLFFAYSNKNSIASTNVSKNRFLIHNVSFIILTRSLILLFSFF